MNPKVIESVIPILVVDLTAENARLKESRSAIQALKPKRVDTEDFTEMVEVARSCSVAAYDDGRCLVAVCTSDSVRTFDIPPLGSELSGGLPKPLWANVFQGGTACAFSPACLRLLAIGSSEGSVLLYNALSGTALTPLNLKPGGDRAAVTHLAWAPAIPTDAQPSAGGRVHGAAPWTGLLLVAWADGDIELRAWPSSESVCRFHLAGVPELLSTLYPEPLSAQAAKLLSPEVCLLKSHPYSGCFHTGALILPRAHR